MPEAPLPDCPVIAHAWAQFAKAIAGSSNAFDEDGWTTRGLLNERLFKGVPASVREVFYNGDVMEAKEGPNTTSFRVRPLAGAAARDLLVAHGACAPIACMAWLDARKRRRSAGTVARRELRAAQREPEAAPRMCASCGAEVTEDRLPHVAFPCGAAMCP